MLPNGSAALWDLTCRSYLADEGTSPSLSLRDVGGHEDRLIVVQAGGNGEIANDFAASIP
jgi:hypothetical protein